jgi:hypothetical protein
MPDPDAAPSAPVELLDRLRGDADRRPVVDPGLAGGLREWLEDGAADALGAAWPRGEQIVVDRRMISSAVGGATAAEVTAPLARAVLVSALFRQLVTTGRIDDPVADALSAVGVDGRGDRIAEFLVRLPSAERAALLAQIVDHAEVLITTWPAVAPAWLPRTAERRIVPVAGGRIVLSGVIDLVLGAPARDRASVCLVDVRTGERRADHCEDRHFLGLLETVCAGAPPFRLATFYSATGEVDVEDVDDELLFAAARRAVDAIHRASGERGPREHPAAAA